MKKLTAHLAGIALVIAAATGCSGSDGDVKGNSKVDMQEAAEKADALVYQTFRAVRPPLDWTHDASDHGSCDGSDAYGDVTRRAVVMTKVSDERRGALLGVIERYWKKSGLKITKVISDKEFPEMYAETGDGLLRTGLVVGGEGQFFLDVQTACVRTSEVRTPATQARGQSYYGKDLPRPNVTDPFWSSREPISH
ncbi:hypothetical protein [Streptomyces sp. PanSC9]|uniref:hypothetical protein n=1 Tax=Streptomyces sp. PanSC9 TaxID=1520461 RepID=UPI000FA2810C|nr:hypothetical protein [Streptomyces sp. PanSC9]ROP46979.1 hypothetical protein EDD94_6648 [Streptomyces sp. PanSC9]